MDGRLAKSLLMSTSVVETAFPSPLVTHSGPSTTPVQNNAASNPIPRSKVNAVFEPGTASPAIADPLVGSAHPLLASMPPSDVAFLPRFSFKVKDAFKYCVAAKKKDAWKMVVIEATSSNLAPPQRKHVTGIMAGLSLGGDIEQKETVVGSIYYHLNKRLNSSDSITVVKALMVLHYTFQVGPEQFQKNAARHCRADLQLTLQSMAAHKVSLASLLHPYAWYVRQMLEMKAAINFPSGTTGRDQRHLSQDRKRWENCSLGQFLLDAPVLMDTILALIRCPPTVPHPLSSMIEPYFKMIHFDWMRFFRVLQFGLLRHLCTFRTLNLKSAKELYSLYTRYVKLVGLSDRFQEVAARTMKDIWSRKLPKPRVVPLNLQESMLRYIQSGPKADKDQDELLF